MLQRIARWNQWRGENPYAQIDLTRADLTVANLTRANLTGANLTRANLTDADLSRANLTRANLSGANLTRADLSRATGILSASEWLAENFTATPDGYLVYKHFGATQYAQPDAWRNGGEGTVCEERGVNPDRGTDCGSGLNFGTRKWCENNYKGAELWECLLAWADLPDVIVPFNSDGKARCARLTKLRRIA